MNKFLILGLILTGAGFCYGQNTSASFEYLVVSPGRASFGLPAKSLSYFSLEEVKEISEAGNVQSALNILGKYGWELAGVVGMIGGDQQLMLKRRLDPRQAAEDQKIMQKRLQEQESLREAELKKSQDEALALEKALQQRTTVVDLDHLEALQKEAAEQNAYIETRKAYRNQLREALKAYSTTIFEDDEASQDEKVYITLDLTATHLRNKNEFRSSAVKEYLDSKLPEVTRIIESVPYEPTTDQVTVTLVGVVSLGREKFSVGTSEQTVYVSGKPDQHWDF